MNEIKIKKCIICEREFTYRTARGKRGRDSKSKRTGKCMTCSRNCSKIYSRVYKYLYQTK